MRTIEVARFADSHRTPVRATTFLALATCLFAACAHPTTTVTIPASRFTPAANPPGHVATLEARLTTLAASPTTAPSATRYLTQTPLATVTMYGTTASIPTLTPTATNTPITHRPAEPAPVILSREEAAARVLAWFLPEQAARVMAVTYVSSVDFWEVVDRLGGDEVMRYAPGTAILTSTERIQNAGGSADDVLALVEVDAGPPRRLAPDFSFAPTWTTLPWDKGPRTGDRRRIGYLFNATTGASLGIPYFGDGHGLLPSDDPGGRRQVVLRALRDRPIQVSVDSTSRSPTHPPPMATGTAIVSPVSTSLVFPGLSSHSCLPRDAEPIRLAPDVVPAPLAESIRWLPYVEGARWTYERTSSYNEGQWTRGQRQITVQERWRLAEDAMLVRLSEVMTATLVPDGAPWGERYPVSEDQWIILLPSASFAVEGCRDDEPHSLSWRREQLGASDLSPGTWTEWGWEVLLDPAARGDKLFTAHWRADTAQALSSIWLSPIDPIRGCRTYGLGDNSSKWERKGYLCPDVGWAAEVNAGCGQWFCIEETDALISYHIPRWRVIP